MKFILAFTHFILHHFKDIVESPCIGELPELEYVELNPRILVT